MDNLNNLKDSPPDSPASQVQQPAAEKVRPSFRLNDIVAIKHEDYFDDDGDDLRGKIVSLENRDRLGIRLFKNGKTIVLKSNVVELTTRKFYEG